MSLEIDAIYEDGVLRPLEPVDLREHERVRLSIAPAACEQPAAASGPQTLHDALVAAGLLGCIVDGPADLSTNPKYMDGFGEHESNSD